MCEVCGICVGETYMSLVYVVVLQCMCCVKYVQCVLYVWCVRNVYFHVWGVFVRWIWFVSHDWCICVLHVKRVCSVLCGCAYVCVIGHIRQGLQRMRQWYTLQMTRKQALGLQYKSLVFKGFTLTSYGF